jgi:hypothetical protein
VRRELEAVPIPGAEDADARSWAVVRGAFDERLPAPAPPRRRRRVALVGAVAGAAVLAFAVSPAGPALVHSVRQAVGLPEAAPALVRLPAPGRLLVNSGAGAWIVEADGSKRLLGRYTAASWSPHGLFEVATRGHELAALDPKGDVRWSLERGGLVRDAAWSPDGYRIAYLAGNTLRVVAGDGTGDALLARNVAPVAPVWEPGATHVLAFVTAGGDVRVVNTDTGVRLAKWRAPEPPRTLLWSADGARLLVIARNRVAVRNAALGPVESILLSKATAVTAAWAPRGERYALIGYDAAADRSAVVTQSVEGAARTVFVGTGHVDALAWSPNGRWLVVSWPTAGQWVFTSASGKRRLHAIASISAQFHSRTFPEPAGWCC